MLRKKTYFCRKCKHIHVFDSEIGRKHIQFNDERMEKYTLDKYGVIK